ncbi:MAG: orotate phosphoribosyltransferase, partial [Raoultibacter sp.]
SNVEREEILAALQDTGAVRHGHFQLTSGRHSDTYIQCARVLEDTRLTNAFAAESIKRLPAGLAIDMVASPAVGGIIFGYAVASALGTKMIFSERKEGVMVFRRNFEVPAGARVLVCEDVVTTGGSVKEVCDLIEEAGGVVVAVVSMINRGGQRKFAQDYYPLIDLPTPSWDPQDCDLCKQGVAIDSPGSRRLAK